MCSVPLGDVLQTPNHRHRRLLCMPASGYATVAAPTSAMNSRRFNPSRIRCTEPGSPCHYTALLTTSQGSLRCGIGLRRMTAAGQRRRSSMVHRPYSIPQYPSKQTCGGAAGVARCATSRHMQCSKSILTRSPRRRAREASPGFQRRAP
jgi:hypothetical protein